MEQNKKCPETHRVGVHRVNITGYQLLPLFHLSWHIYTFLCVWQRKLRRKDKGKNRYSIIIVIIINNNNTNSNNKKYFIRKQIKLQKTKNTRINKLLIMNKPPKKQTHIIK